MRSGGSEDCKRVKSVWAPGCSWCSCCWSGSVAVDADAEEGVELSPSIVAVSTSSREDEVAAAAAGRSPSVEGVGELTERVASCSLSPFCACETYAPRSLRAVSIALWLFGDATGTEIRDSA